MITRVGIIGLGYWGPNLVRTFDSLPDVKVTALCDRDTERLRQLTSRFPHLHATDQAEELLSRDLVDAVVIATPTGTHYALAKRALERGLHTFVEKPLATTSAECEELIELAHTQGAQLFVGHVFLYTAAVAKLKELIENEELGELCYISSTRLNLGPVRKDVNALWDLAPHDISIILHLVGSLPTSVNCQGVAYLNRRIHDVCSLTMHFPSGLMAIIHISWLDPNKTRRMTIVGNRQMAVYDDVDPLEKVKIYDKGVEAPAYPTDFAEFQFSYRYGDTRSPRLIEEEPLRTECKHFIDCIQQGLQPKTDGRNGLDVVRVLEAADISLHDSGGRVYLEAQSELSILNPATPIRMWNPPSPRIAHA
ncbi:MAG: Gfo/Idh/MocA family oxidoreductase [Chloroflexota bacterium]|nr:Gfo/Idh/MocA family oxidoreductase [Chloroflexota bacterium]